MDLYTLTDQFLAKDVIDQYVSAIWTERYFEAGDTQLVVPATEEAMEKLKDGTFLALRGSKEVMELQTQSIENDLITVIGTSLVEFLDQRLSWFQSPTATDSLISDYMDETRKPGEFIAHVVDRMVINPTLYTSGFSSVNLDWALEVIEHLELGDVDTSGTVERLTMPTGPLYTGIKQLARKAGLGISLYLDSADPLAGYVLKFTTYKGKDRTTGSAYSLIRLSPDLDSLSDLKEVRSRANHKNVCYVSYNNEVSVHYEDPAAPVPEGFARRVLVTDADGAPVGRKVQTPTGGGWGPGWVIIEPAGSVEIAAFREQHARDALANHNYIKAIDGQTSPQNDYKYGVDYGLGDVIELQGISGSISKARITEYIRSEDATGEKEYPTISVLGDEG